MTTIPGMTTYRSLREYVAALERAGDLLRVPFAVDPRLEMTELCNRSLRADGPALIFDQPKGHSSPAISNLFGSQRRVIGALGLNDRAELRRIGEMLAALKEPQWPNGLGAALKSLPTFKPLLHAAPRVVEQAAFQEHVVTGPQINLEQLPIQTCWPEDAGPLITWGLVVTRGPLKPRLNIGIYRQQLIARNKLIMRWLPHRGGAQDFKEWQQRHPGSDFPVAVAIGADPATLLAAVTPIPDTLSEFQFAGLLRGARSEVARCGSSDLLVPASAEIVLEGRILAGEQALEGPFGDHTGYYNSQAPFPVFTVERLSCRDRPLYHTGYMGRSPWDEPSVLASVLNEVFVPILQRIFPEVVDFHLPPEACSYRIAVLSIRKGYPGHARRLMFAVWSYLRQFTYTKFVIVTDEDINVRDWQQVLWAIATRVDPGRDTVIVENTPIDYLDFASPIAGLGSKLGIDATNKWPGETQRQWGRPLQMTPEVVRKVDTMWAELQHSARSTSKLT